MEPKKQKGKGLNMGDILYEVIVQDKGLWDKDLIRKHFGGKGVKINDGSAISLLARVSLMPGIEVVRLNNRKCIRYTGASQYDKLKKQFLYGGVKK
jgi:hypothetical protein